MNPHIELAFRLISWVLAAMWMMYFAYGFKNFWEGEIKIALEQLACGCLCFVLACLLVVAGYYDIPRT